MQHCRKQANVMSRIRRSATKHHLFWDFADGSHQLGFIFDIWLECFEAGPFTFCTPQMSRFHHKTIIFWLLREIPVLKWKFTRAGCYMWSQNNLFGRGEAACGSPPKMIFKGTTFYCLWSPGRSVFCMIEKAPSMDDLKIFIFFWLYLFYFVHKIRL